MKEQVVSKTWAMALRKMGLDKRTLFCWVGFSDEGSRKITEWSVEDSYECNLDNIGNRVYYAPTFKELIIIIPNNFKVDIKYRNGVYYQITVEDVEGKVLHISCKAVNICNALAHTIIALIKKEIIKL